MPFVKLDTRILDSTLWVERECREIFLTALLMAEPWEVTEPMPQIRVRTLELTGFDVPPGWYGFVPCAGIGIIRRAMVSESAGYEALEKLGSSDLESRSNEFDGRRLVRVDGGFVVLNYMRYRERDYTAAERAKRYREKRGTAKNSPEPSHRDTVTAHRDAVMLRRDVTQADADADAESRERLGASRAQCALQPSCFLIGFLAILGAASWRCAERPARHQPIEPRVCS